ncbi:cytochrome P450 4C1-like [Phymastichus coffea]|uniref:cytochrome P450 4C1-like n=1 Tax=Phymastichus coffea TaxID=108790 RepID=UPI00273B41E4|nr:cytochrome P450 4C1-like [Phymastichus coffea]
MHTPNEDRFQWFNNLTRKFKNGIILTWIGVEPIVTINKPEYMEVVLPSNRLITKAKMYDIIKPWLGDGLVTSTGEIWLKHRRIITPAFHFNILEEYAAAMRDKVEILIDSIEAQLDKSRNSPINVFELTVKYTLDTICETAMGINIDCQRIPNSEYVKALHNFAHLSSDRFFRFWLRWDALYYYTEKGQEFLKAIKTMHNFTEKVIIYKQLERRNKLAKNPSENNFDDCGKRKRKAFLDLLFDASEKTENALSLREIREEVDTFMFAGHDTISAAISWALFALGNAPEIQNKVHEELNEVFSNKTEVASMKQLGQLKYLDRVIKEVLRLYPSAPSISRRVDSDTIIGDYLIPKGTILNIHIYQLHHNPDVWDDPVTASHNLVFFIFNY